MARANPSELQNLAGILASCATQIEGCTEQIRGSFSTADSWQDGHRGRFEEAIANCAASIRNHAEMIQEMSGQIEAHARRYEELDSGG